VVDLLELSRLEGGEEQPRLEPLSVAQALGSAAAPWQPDASVEVDADADLYVLADRVRFRRVLANLVTNALDHGEGLVTVSARRAGDVVVIDVADRGPGIRPEDAERVFDRFFKCDVSRSNRGSGLGLSIARESARMQGGDLAVTNPGTGGACFTFTLPAAEPPGDPTPPASSSASDGRPIVATS
jgi:two-component system sensor histidine kinase MtrB